MAQSSRIHARTHTRKKWITLKRFGVSKRRGLALACACLVLLLCGAGFLLRNGSGIVLHRSELNEASLSESVSATASEDAINASAGTSQDTVQQTATAKAMVHVDGAVVSPGVYELSFGSRVCDALDAAGGLAEDADTSQINLAAEIADGEKVYIPREGEVVTNVGTSQAGTNASDSGLVNINTATVEQLDTLPGVGEATATAIVKDREQNGAFTSPEDLMRVSGIGEKKFERLEGLICV